MKIYLLVTLMFGGCFGEISSKCSIHAGIKWYDIQAVFDSLDPCTPNPCAKGHVCRINEGTYQHYCEVCKPINGTNVENEASCKHTTSFENLLLMCFSGFYRALPLLRQLPSEKLNMCLNVIGQQPLETLGLTGRGLNGQNQGTGTTTIGATTSRPKELCKPNPCQNGGKCYSNAEAQDYYCVCPNHNSGKSCEEIVFNDENRITSGFRATQMNDYDGTFIADKAIDGNPVTVTATKSHGKNPWWQIDFQLLYRIVGITVVNRKQCCPERLHDFEVRVGNKSMTSTNVNQAPNELCHFHRGAGIALGGSLDIYCKLGSIVGRYLTIQIIEPCSTQNDPHCAAHGNILSLAEVRFYGNIHTRF